MHSKVKIWVDDLQMGMYVSQLDRPWVETPFLFQGFNIQSQDDIQKLKKFCKFVVVDQDKSKFSDANDVFLRRSSAVSDDKSPLNPDSGTTLVLPDSMTFRRQMRQAMDTHQSTRKYITQIMSDVQRGRQVDIKQAKVLVESLTDNIMQNPTALIWLTQLKSRDEYTAIHSLNVCVLSLFFGRSIGLNKAQLQEMGTGALLHDIGKLKVPLEVLNKPGQLTREEFGIMKKHTMYGYKLFRDKDEIS